MDNIFEVKNLCFSYYRQPLCINDASFSIAKNNRVLLLASKDMGKSTALKVLSGFEDSYFGSILYKNKELKDYNDSDKLFSLLLSEPILINSTVKKNLDYLCEILNIDRLSNDQIDELLKNVFLNQRADTKIKKLSLLEKRKLAIARMILKNPDVIFLDDQFDGLNDFEIEEMKNLYSKVFDLNKTVFFAIGGETLKKQGGFLKSLNINKVLYLCYSKIYEYQNVAQFEEQKINFDVIGFFDDYKIVDGLIEKRDNKYYFISENGFYVSLGDCFDVQLNSLMIENGESQKVKLCHKKTDVCDFENNENFIKSLKNKKAFIYSMLDGEKVI